MLMRLCLLLLAHPIYADWQEWWTYDGISGPSYWGVINPAWGMCSKGKAQSPVNIRPRALVYDPTLKPVVLDKSAAISGVLVNTGQSLVFRVDRGSGGGQVNITGGPLSYRYVFEELFLHWSLSPDDPNGPHGSGAPSTAFSSGSEHSIDKRFYPAELQLYGYNAELFRNLSEAISSPHGVVALAIMVQETERDGEANPALKTIASHFDKVIYHNQNYPISRLHLSELMPSTDGYMTYDGSTTYPGCWESVTWMIMNKPIYVASSDLSKLRKLMQGDSLTPKAPLANNNRPIQDLNNRSVRTNIIFENVNSLQRRKDPSSSKGKKDKDCPDVLKDTYYKANANQWGT